MGRFQNGCHELSVFSPAAAVPKKPCSAENSAFSLSGKALARRPVVFVACMVSSPNGSSVAARLSMSEL